MNHEIRWNQLQFMNHQNLLGKLFLIPNIAMVF